MDEEAEKFCLRWAEFEQNIIRTFKDLRSDKDFYDVTLVCGEKQVQAHRVILAACSPTFRDMISRSPHHHPVLYLRGIRPNDLVTMLDFMYHGEVMIASEELETFLATAQDLSVRGLAQAEETETAGQEEQEPRNVEEALNDDVENLLRRLEGGEPPEKSRKLDSRSKINVKKEPGSTSELALPPSITKLRIKQEPKSSKQNPPAPSEDSVLERVEENRETSANKRSYESSYSQQEEPSRAQVPSVQNYPGLNISTVTEKTPEVSRPQPSPQPEQAPPPHQQINQPQRTSLPLQTPQPQLTSLLQKTSQPQRTPLPQQAPQPQRTPLPQQTSHPSQLPQAQLTPQPQRMTMPPRQPLPQQPPQPQRTVLLQQHQPQPQRLPQPHQMPQPGHSFIVGQPPVTGAQQQVGGSTFSNSSAAPGGSNMVNNATGPGGANYSNNAVANPQMLRNVAPTLLQGYASNPSRSSNTLSSLLTSSQTLQGSASNFLQSLSSTNSLSSGSSAPDQNYSPMNTSNVTSRALSYLRTTPQLSQNTHSSSSTYSNSSSANSALAASIAALGELNSVAESSVAAAVGGTHVRTSTDDIVAKAFDFAQLGPSFNFGNNALSSAGATTMSASLSSTMSPSLSTARTAQSSSRIPSKPPAEIFNPRPTYTLTYDDNAALPQSSSSVASESDSQGSETEGLSDPESYLEKVQTPEGPKLRCKVCQKMGNSKGKAQMITHVESVHMNSSIECHVCNKTFKAKSYLRKHQARGKCCNNVINQFHT